MMKRVLMISALVALPVSAAMAQSDTKTPATITPPIGTTTPGVVNPPVGTTTPGTGATGTGSATVTTTTSRTNITFVQQQTADQMLASGLMGATVRGSADETIGEVDDVIFDRDGRVHAVVIGVGGFLGIGEKNVAVPLASVQLSHDADNARVLRVSMATSKDALKAAPEFKKIDKRAAGSSSTTGATGSGPMPPKTTVNPQ